MTSSASRTTDLYRTVKASTEWPTNGYSIKTLAQYLGFEWRDENPSGAASIEWYNRFVEKGAGLCSSGSSTTMRMAVGRWLCCSMLYGN